MFLDIIDLGTAATSRPIGTTTTCILQQITQLYSADYLLHIITRPNEWFIIVYVPLSRRAECINIYIGKYVAWCIYMAAHGLLINSLSFGGKVYTANTSLIGAHAHSKKRIILTVPIRWIYICARITEYSL